MTAIAMTAMMRAYSTRPCPSSSRMNVNTGTPPSSLRTPQATACVSLLAVSGGRNGTSVLALLPVFIHSAAQGRGTYDNSNHARGGGHREGRVVDSLLRDLHRRDRSW